MGRAGKHAVLAAFFAASLALAPSCGGPSGDGERPRAAEPEEDSAPVSEEGKKWGGWRWKGKRDDCFYIHDNECFADKKAACRAAGCGESRCKEKANTAPIKVRCLADR
jgi:hypothetical protein